MKTILRQKREFGDDIFTEAALVLREIFPHNQTPRLISYKINRKLITLRNIYRFRWAVELLALISKAPLE
jgi:hypothetical protein